jgi:hypothetical protein
MSEKAKKTFRIKVRKKHSSQQETFLLVEGTHFCKDKELAELQNAELLN